MIKRKGHWCHCEACNSEHYIDDGYDIICDTCGQTCLDYYEIGKVTRIEINLGGIICHFDSLQCAFRFIIEELKKERKNNQDLDTQRGEKEK